MKNRILLMLLLSFAVSASAQVHKALVVEMRDGSTASFPLAEKPRITFEGELMDIVSSAADMQLVRTDVRKYSFVDAQTSVDEAFASSEAVIYGNVIIISGVPDRTVVGVYSINGVVVMRAIAVGGSSTLSLENLPAGLYIVNYNNTSIKFQKK